MLFLAKFLLLSSLVQETYIENFQKNTSQKYHLVEFRLFYPFLTTKNFTTSSGIYVPTKHGGRTGLGLSLGYYFFVQPRLGIILEPQIWLMPLKMRGSKRTSGGASLSTGFILRPLPKLYFDPTMALLAGAGLFDSGPDVKVTFAFPVQARLSFDLLRDTGPFSDGTLALSMTGSVSHYFHMIPSLEPWIYEVGLGIRGSF